MIKKSYKDIVLHKYYKSIHQSYIDFINKILVDSKSTDNSSVFNGINKVIRILSLDAQKCIINRTLKIKTHTPEDNIFSQLRLIAATIVVQIFL